MCTVEIVSTTTSFDMVYVCTTMVWYRTAFPVNVQYGILGARPSRKWFSSVVIAYIMPKYLKR